MYKFTNKNKNNKENCLKSIVYILFTLKTEFFFFCKNYSKKYYQQTNA